MYARFGAEAVGKTPFNKEFVPPDWDGVNDYPVVAMIFPKTVGEAARLFTKRIIKLNELRNFDKYDELLRYRDKLLHSK